MQQHRKDEHLKDIVLTNKFAGYHPDVNKPCRFCGTIFKKQSGLTLHEKTCIENPNRIKIKGHKLSEEHKKKLSEIAIKNMRGTHTNWLNKKKSYAEEYFDKIFLNAEKQYRVNRFVLDYAWPEKKIYIEVDGEQHYTEEGLKHDKIRTEILLEEGWVCAKRIRWSNFQKLSRQEKEEFIKNLPRVSETDISRKPHKLRNTGSDSQTRYTCFINAINWFFKVFSTNQKKTSLKLLLPPWVVVQLRAP